MSFALPIVWFVMIMLVVKCVLLDTSYLILPLVRSTLRRRPQQLMDLLLSHFNPTTRIKLHCFMCCL